MALPFNAERLRIPARDIRTGHVIRGYGNHWRTLEVCYSTWDTFTNPEGTRMVRIRFSGWERFMGEPTGEWIENGFGHGADSAMTVVDDMRDLAGVSPATFRCLA